MSDEGQYLEQSVLHAVAGRWLEALSDGSREIVCLFSADASLQFLSVSNIVGDMLGYDAFELSRNMTLELIHPDDREIVRNAFATLVAQPGARNTVEYRLRHHLGHYVVVQSTAVNRLHDEIIRAVVVHTRPAPPAEGDSGPPSGQYHTAQLCDRAVFTRAVAAAVERKRTDPTYGFTVLILELDRHKMLLGSYGQEVVDKLLAEVGRRLVALLRPEDTLAQFGGGEFAILLDGVRDRRRAARVAERIQKTVGMGYQIGNQTISTSGIVGIATSERAYERAEHVIRDAALAANRGRRGRKRRAVFQTQMRVEDTRFMMMVSELHNAIQTQQFRLYYQPIVSLGTRTLAGFEALLRWQHPKQGIVSPAQFIPVAEETGLIVQIGRWVLEEACRQMAQWHREFTSDPPLHVSVNLSAKQFADEDLSLQIEQILNTTGLDARQLELEITETAVLENRDAAAEALGRLKTHGVRVSLDDFGTGYSSFSYLHQLPYDTLKIDRSFVSRIGSNGENSEIIHAIIVLAHNLRMNVVAEGVETANQASQLKTMWCEFAQGYYFARPLDAQAAGELIAAYPQW